MDDSLKVPTATSFRTLSVAVLDAQRRQINGDLAAAGRKEKLSFTHLIAWAIIVAGSEIPNMNTGFERRETKAYALRRENVSLGLAVDVERKDGGRTLMVPVIKDANVLGFNGFRGAYDDLVKRTRTGGKGYLGVDEAIATRARLDEQGRYTGEVEFYAYGPHKAEAIRRSAELQDIDLDASWATADIVMVERQL